MTRWIWVIFTACAAGFFGSAGWAGTDSIPNYDGRLLRRHAEQSRQARAEELRIERAMRRARLRDQEWHGPTKNLPRHTLSPGEWSAARPGNRAELRHAFRG